MQRLRHPVRAIREPFGKAGLTVAILALVFAMVGGAWAAAGLNGKQKKQVTKIAKKYAGKAGATGAAGANGTNGTNGAKGDTGAAGTNGTNGTNGTSVTTSAATVGECPDGGTKFTSASPASKVCNGETGFTETLPEGKTETGSWAAAISGEGFAPVSFNIPLEAVIPAANVHKTGDVGFATPCGGTAADPEANPGHLCIYTGFLTVGTAIVGIFPTTGPPSVEGAAKSGAIVFLAGGEGGAGTFAVTAE